MILGTVVGQVITQDIGVIAGAVLNYPEFTFVGEQATARVVESDEVVIDPVVAAMEEISHDPAQRQALLAAVVDSHLGGKAPPPKDSADTEEEEEEGKE